MSQEDLAGVEVRKGEKFADALKRNGIKGAVAASLNGIEMDLTTVAEEPCTITPIDIESPDGLKILRHSAAHLLANAVTDIFPDANPNAGPPTEDGFYYDIKMDPVNQETLERIEKRMKEIASQDIPIMREVLPRKRLLEIFRNNPFKTEKIEESIPEGGSSSVYRQGNFVDFCRGPHVPSTGYIRNVKLLSVASAHYRGDETKPELVRIYGTAFPSAESLKLYLKNREEAARRDHRKVGQEMDLFVFNSERAPGFPFYTPNGTVLKNELTQFMKELNMEYGWEDVQTPHVFRDTIWKQSGHYAKYRENMFLFTIADGDTYGLKPMNCPGHISIFERKPHSYRDLPVLYSEPGTVYRYEKSGEVGGLTRPRMFTVDDGHGFLRPDQILSEISRIIEMIRRTFNTVFGNIELTFDLSAIDREKPENYLIRYICRNCGNQLEARRSSLEESLSCPRCGSSELDPDFSLWDQATDQLRNALNDSGIPFREIPGEAAFYGPKIDVHIKDALGRSWQLSTIQVDFFMPSNFGLFFINQESKQERIIMLHRAIFGSYERFMAILIEHFSGKFPTWLSPLQAFIVPVSEKFSDYATSVERELRKLGIRARADTGTDTMNKKIKMIRIMRPSYIMVVGEREQNEGSVSVRNRENSQKVLPLKEAAEIIRKEIMERSHVQYI